MRLLCSHSSRAAPAPASAAPATLVATPACMHDRITHEGLILEERVRVPMPQPAFVARLGGLGRAGKNPGGHSAMLLEMVTPPGSRTRNNGGNNGGHARAGSGSWLVPGQLRTGLGTCCAPFSPIGGRKVGSAPGHESVHTGSDTPSKQWQ